MCHEESFDYVGLYNLFLPIRFSLIRFTIFISFYSIRNCVKKMLHFNIVTLTSNLWNKFVSKQNLYSAKWIQGNLAYSATILSGINTKNRKCYYDKFWRKRFLKFCINLNCSIKTLSKAKLPWLYSAWLTFFKGKKTSTLMQSA